MQSLISVFEETHSCPTVEKPYTNILHLLFLWWWRWWRWWWVCGGQWRWLGRAWTPCAIIPPPNPPIALWFKRPPLNLLWVAKYRGNPFNLFCEDNFSHNRLLLCPSSKPAELLHSEPREISVIGQIKKVGQRARGRWSWSNLRSCRCLLKETEGRRVCLRVGGGHHSSNCQSPSAVF